MEISLDFRLPVCLFFLKEYQEKFASFFLSKTIQVLKGDVGQLSL